MVSAVRLLLWALVVPVLLSSGAALAGSTVERVAYILGPVSDDPDRQIAILKGRLATWKRYPDITVVEDGLRVEIDRDLADPLLQQILTARGFLAFHAVDDLVLTCPDALAPGTACLPGLSPDDGAYVVLADPALSGEILQAVDQVGDARGLPALSFRFTAEGTKLFGEFTTLRLGQTIAVVVDGVVISAPRIMEPILGGSGLLSGDDQDIAVWMAILSEPPLERPLQILREEAAEPVTRGRRRRK